MNNTVDAALRRKHKALRKKVWHDAAPGNYYSQPSCVCRSRAHEQHLPLRSVHSKYAWKQTHMIKYLRKQRIKSCNDEKTREAETAC